MLGWFWNFQISVTGKASKQQGINGVENPKAVFIDLGFSVPQISCHSDAVMPQGLDLCFGQILLLALGSWLLNKKLRATKS